MEFKVDGWVCDVFVKDFFDGGGIVGIVGGVDFDYGWCVMMGKRVSIVVYGCFW